MAPAERSVAAGPMRSRVHDLLEDAEGTGCEGPNDGERSLVASSSFAPPRGSTSGGMASSSRSRTRLGVTCDASPEHEDERKNAERWEGILERWLRRTHEKELEPGPFKRLRARRARRICLLEACGNPKFQLSTEDRERLSALDLHRTDGPIRGACSATEVPEAAPASSAEPREPEEQSTCPDFKAPPAKSGKKLWLVADYPMPPAWKGHPKREAKDALRPGGWAPTNKDFWAAVPTGADAQTAESAAEIRSKLKKAGKVAELNIVGHGNSSGIGMSGTVTPNKGGEVSVGFGNIFTAADFKPDTHPEVRESLVPGAAINLFSCHAAGGAIGMAKLIAENTCTAVRASPNQISYCPSINNPPTRITDRNWVFVEPGTTADGSCAELRQRGFRNLIPSLRTTTPGKKHKPIVL